MILYDCWNMKKLLLFEKWFDMHLGIFFVNGRKVDKFKRRMEDKYGPDVFTNLEKHDINSK